MRPYHVNKHVNEHEHCSRIFMNVFAEASVVTAGASGAWMLCGLHAGASASRVKEGLLCRLLLLRVAVAVVLLAHDRHLEVLARQVVCSARA